MRTAIAALAALGLSACSTGSVEVFEQCSVAFNLDQSAAAIGASVTAEGGPFGERWDNAVSIDGTLATVVSVDQTERLKADGTPYEADACNRCNTCRDNNPGHCNRCRSVCGACTETLVFSIPEVTPGTRSIQLQNRWGSSDQQTLLVEPGPSAGTGGTGASAATGGTGPSGATGGTGGAVAGTGGTGP